MARDFDLNEIAMEARAGSDELEEFAQRAIDEYLEARSPRARVFISCGQREGLESETAAKIGAVLASHGFEFYIAAHEASLVGLKENVYRQLENCEYILFVDFRRDQLANKEIYRGSLFSHQELALAAYLGLDWMPFQQVGVERNGIMSFIQSNVASFSNPEELPKLVEHELKNKSWSPHWKNGLTLSRKEGEFEDARNNVGRMNRFFHASVRNVHRTRLAHGCVAFVERIQDVTNETTLPVRATELAWAGFAHPAAAIVAGAERELDLGYVDHASPHVLVFNSYSTSTGFMSPIQGPGEFDIGYVVVPDNLPPVRTTCRVTLSTDLSLTKIRQIAGIQ